MSSFKDLEKIAISVKSHRILSKLIAENPLLAEIVTASRDVREATFRIKAWVLDDLRTRPQALRFYRNESQGRAAYNLLLWRDYAAIRILDYINHAGRDYVDLNQRGEKAVTDPFYILWLAINRGTGGAKPDFFEDMLWLFRQFTGKSRRQTPSRKRVQRWMERFPSGLDPRIVELRRENRDRIINVIIDRLDSSENPREPYIFSPGMSREDKYFQMLEWWQEGRFHLRFAIRTPELLNEMLGYSLDFDTMQILKDAKKAGIPFFVNPYYLSLINVRTPEYAVGGDQAIRDYVLYSRELVDEFGHIVAWEKEDEVEPGKPNAAGWILPSHYNIHRRYPGTAILIPDTMGRACGGLCSVCQRMYDFQSGHLNFRFSKLKPLESWGQKMERLMAYFENDSQLRDILVTGGDAFMSSNISLQKILDAILRMAERKRTANLSRKDGEKYAEIQQVRLGSRLPVYLPQRVTPNLVRILADFKEKALKIGIRRFIVQTHYQSPMEITPESKEAVERLISAGWTVTNQTVFTTSASRRGHNARLREVLNNLGILPYYTFSTKGYMENWHHFVPNARAVQEQLEEKVLGRIPSIQFSTVKKLTEDPENVVEQLNKMRRKLNKPFLATDRNVMNLPGVGKSLTFRVIGITRYGRRILEFAHDTNRRHSPIIEKMNKIIIIESKTMTEYLKQLEDIGEDAGDYLPVYGYSIGETEPRIPVFQYLPYDFTVTDTFTNLVLDPD